MLVITFDQPEVAQKILLQVRHRRTDLPLLVHTMDPHAQELLQQAGATEVLPRVLDISILIGAELLLRMGVPPERVEAHHLAQLDQHLLVKKYLHREDPATRAAAGPSGKPQKLDTGRYG
jgi:CPA2 family monovalent cation:H+ antiporter-2